MLSKEKFTKHLARKVQEMRQKRDMSQEELADKAGLYRTYVGHIENGRYNPSVYILYKIVKALDIDPRDFFKV